MPFVNGKFYINPTIGRVLERNKKRAIIVNFAQGRPFQESAPQADSNGHWVTIDGRHVFIHEAQRTAKSEPSALSGRDKAYLDKYYEPVVHSAKKYNVDPALVLGLGFESGFASAGTYLRRGDAFGLTGGHDNGDKSGGKMSENYSIPMESRFKGPEATLMRF